MCHYQAEIKQFRLTKNKVKSTSQKTVLALPKCTNLSLGWNGCHHWAHGLSRHSERDRGWGNYCYLLLLAFSPSAAGPGGWSHYGCGLLDRCCCCCADKCHLRDLREISAALLCCCLSACCCCCCSYCSLRLKGASCQVTRG